MRYAASVAARAFNEKALSSEPEPRAGAILRAEGWRSKGGLLSTALGAHVCCPYERRAPVVCRGRVASSEASTGTTWPKASATSPRIGAANRIVGAETIPQNLFCECAGHLEASLRAARWC